MTGGRVVPRRAVALVGRVVDDGRAPGIATSGMSSWRRWSIAWRACAPRGWEIEGACRERSAAWSPCAPRTTMCGRLDAVAGRPGRRCSDRATRSDHVHRTPHRLGVFVSRGGVVAGHAHRARGRTRAIRRWRCSIATGSTARRSSIAPPRRPASRPSSAPNSRWATRHGRARGAGAVATDATWTLPGARRERAGLSASVPGDHARHDCVPAKGEARFTLEDFAGQASGLVALVGREALARRSPRGGRPGRSAWSASSAVRTCGSNCSAICSATIRRTSQSLARSRRGVSRAGDGLGRRALRHTRGAAAVRRAHQHSAQDHARGVRGGGWRSTPSGI